MSGFKALGGAEDFDRVFMTTTNLFNKFVGNNIWAWGRDNYGQLGDGTTVNKSSPVTTVGGANWKQVSCGYRHTVALKTDGTLWTWGWNTSGDLGTNNTTHRSSPQTATIGGTSWVSVSAGLDMSAALKSDGTIWMCGYNSYGQLGINTSTVRATAFALTMGTSYNTINCGGYHNIALKNDNTLWMWGRNLSGEIGDGTTSNRWSPIQPIASSTWKNVDGGGNGAGGYTLGIKTDGTLWGWGMNTSGQIGDGTSVDKLVPTQNVLGGSTWSQVSCGSTTSAAIKTDGTLWTCGDGAGGKLGNNTETSTLSFVSVAGGGTNWKTVTSGINSCAAIKTDGTLWTWGKNTMGELGNGTSNNNSSPSSTALNSTWSSVGSSIGPFIAALLGV